MRVRLPPLLIPGGSREDTGRISDGLCCCFSPVAAANLKIKENMKNIVHLIDNMEYMRGLPDKAFDLAIAFN